MTIKQQGGIFGRNPTFNDVEVDGTLTLGGSALPSVSNTPTLDGNQTFSGNNTFTGDVIQGSVNLANSTGTGNVILSVDPTFSHTQTQYSGDGRVYSHDILTNKSDVPDNTAFNIFTFTKGAGGASSSTYSHFAGTLLISSALQLTGGYNVMEHVTIPFSLDARGANNATLDQGTNIVATASNNTGGTTSYTLSLSTATNTSAVLALTVDCSNRTINLNDIGIKLTGVSSCSANALRLDVERS